MPARKKLLIYGAYGYTGKLIVDECLASGLKPVLAGRDYLKTTELAESKDIESVVFSLNNTDEITRILKDYHTVLHCAGPFMYTARTMVEACLSSKTNYLDITGEIQVFEMMASLGTRAKNAKITLLPGVGFDVVPSDCMAAYIHSLLPDAQKLILAIYSKGGISRGTSRTMIENMEKGGAVRKGGKIIPVKTAWKSHTFDFGGIRVNTTTIPWGDVSTAWHSTGIPNIEVYMSMPKPATRMLKASRFLKPLLKANPVKNLLRNKILHGPEGPNRKARETGETRIIATALNAHKRMATALLIGPEGYTLTAKTAVESAKRVLKGKVPHGFQTPSKAFGADYITEFEGVKREHIAS